MKATARLLALGGCLLASPAAIAAIAADPPGLLTLVMGVPLLLSVSVLLALLLILRPGTVRRRLARIVFIPTLLYSLYVALDAVTLLQELGTENAMIGLAFFALLAVACGLFHVANAFRDKRTPAPHPPAD